MIGSLDRQSKAQGFRDDGIALFPHSRFPRTARVADALEYGEPTACTLAGRLVSRRLHATANFYDLRDASGVIQLVTKPEYPAHDLLARLDIGDWVSATGETCVMRRGQVSLLVRACKLESKSLQAPPDRAGVTDSGTLLRHRHLDLLGNEKTRDLFRTRAKIIAAIRSWLDVRGFIEVEAPTLQALAGGSSSQPFVTYHHALKRRLNLSLSPEQYVNRCVVGGLESVYALGKVYRNEGLSRKHQPEFTEIEFMEPGSYMDSMHATESIIAHAAFQALGTTEIACQGELIDLAEPWERITMRELIHQRFGMDFMQASRDELATLIADDEQLETKAQVVQAIYTKAVEQTLIQPTFVTDMPAEPFVMCKRNPADFYLAEHADAVIGGIEIASIDTELNDPVEQFDRFAEQAERQGREGVAPQDEAYVKALSYGMPPTGGTGMGIDRLVMILTERESIREVIPFPTLRMAATQGESA